jgi:hypothetical protein
MYAEKQHAKRLLKSQRGILILCQAFHHAIKALESVEPSYLKEESNIKDMKLLREHIFNQFPAEVFEPIEPKNREMLLRIHKGGDFNES